MLEDVCYIMSVIHSLTHAKTFIGLFQAFRSWGRLKVPLPYFIKKATLHAIKIVIIYAKEAIGKQFAMQIFLPENDARIRCKTQALTLSANHP